jgi:hypothetical protein
VTERLNDTRHYQISQKSAAIAVVVVVLGLLHVIRRKDNANLTDEFL